MRNIHVLKTPRVFFIGALLASLSLVSLPAHTASNENKAKPSASQLKKLKKQSSTANKTSAKKKTNTSSAKASKANKVNVNTASLEQLVDALDGVGLVKAKAIIAYRNNKGKFKRIDDLLKVSGIGESILKKNKSRLRL